MDIYTAQYDFYDECSVIQKRRLPVEEIGNYPQNLKLRSNYSETIM